LAGGAGTGGTTLLGRRTQCEALNQLLTDVMAGTSPVVTVLRGDAGVGKSALLGYVSHRVNGWQATTVGVDQRWNWPTSACINCAHRCWITSTGCPSHSERRSPRAFGLGVGAVSDRFLVGLATRSLFADIAEQQPLVCLVDDTQWLDQASAQILAFVARRLVAERIVLVCAARRGERRQGTDPVLR
jgi:predicted ATPase